MGGKNEKQILTLGPYSFVGELALIDGLNRSASVVAKGDTEAISIEEEDLSQEIKRNPDLAYELLKVMAQKLRMTNDVLLKMLGTVEPICVNCNKIKDKNSWISLDKYVRDYSQIAIQHTICPSCSEKLFPQFYNFS
jgi:CRP-like cAMP-binding protein